MEKKIIAILVCILFFGASVCPSITGYDKHVEKIDYIQDEHETLNLKNDNYNNLIKQAIKSGIISSNNWSEQDKLLPSDGAANEGFGRAASIDGNTALIGALHDDLGGDSGSAYVFTRSGSDWTQQAKLLASDGADDDWFGRSVSLDGDTALIGASVDINDGNGLGSAYVFTRSGTNWTQQAKLLPSDGAEGDWFGYSVSIDEDYALMGAWGDDDNGDWSGSAYVFTRSGTNWTQQAKLLASDGAEGDWFGKSVSLDGDTALIGTPHDDDNEFWSGSAYVFTRSGTDWTQQAKLLASDGAEGDRFGGSVSLDSDTALIGAPCDSNNKIESGSAYVFTRSGTNWTQQAKLLPPVEDETGKGHFGQGVSIDKDYAIIGQPWYYGIEGSGSAYVFTRSGSDWTQQAKLLPSDGAPSDLFGLSLSIDNNYALIGAHRDQDNGENSGSAYIFVNRVPDFTIDGLSPIDLNVTDADGRFINKTFSNIPGAIYTEEDLDGDGELDDRVFIPDAIDGLYTIEVIPEPDAEPTDTYSLKTTFMAVVYNLATDVMIQDIPPEGYNISWPDKPSTPDGPPGGKVGETYTYTSFTSDPDGDDVYYLFDWGDGTDTGWIETGEANHTWSKKGSYKIKVKAKDTHDFESRWSDPLVVTMPRDKAMTNSLLLCFLERFPILQLLFQRLGLQ
jgi:hypothetical protein